VVFPHPAKKKRPRAEITRDVGVDTRPQRLLEIKSPSNPIQGLRDFIVKKPVTPL
jgi:hypothetical protein